MSILHRRFAGEAFGLSISNSSGLSWVRFCGLTIVDPVPDASTLWDFRETLIGKGALALLFERLDQAIKDAGYLRMTGLDYEKV